MTRRFKIVMLPAQNPFALRSEASSISFGLPRSPKRAFAKTNSCGRGSSRASKGGTERVDLLRDLRFRELPTVDWQESELVELDVFEVRQSGTLRVNGKRWRSESDVVSWFFGRIFIFVVQPCGYGLRWW